MNVGGECRMSGGGGGGLISLDDLQSLSDEQLSDSAENEHEDEYEHGDGDDRLLHYWRDVARGHQVDVPEDMAQPIQQITTNNDGTHTRERVPYTLITHKEKCGEVLWEKRHYEKSNWACITVYEDTYEQSICYGFMRIMKYICHQNSAGPTNTFHPSLLIKVCCYFSTNTTSHAHFAVSLTSAESYLGMTIPIVTVIHTDERRTTLSRAVTVAYYLPTQHQSDPPQPYDTDISIEQWPAMIVYSRAFTGATNELSIIREISSMFEVLDSPGDRVNDSFIVAGYTNPAAADRQNEIWFLERP